MSEIQSKRLQRVYETAKNSLSISTQVSIGGGVQTPATMYQMDISFRSTRNKWSIAKRYSEFYTIRQQLRKFVKQFKQQQGELCCPVPLVALDKTLEAAFPRRHLRNDNTVIIAERKTALETFVQSLVKVVSSIPMAADVNGGAQAKLLLALYTILRDFLEYPDKQIESETKLKLAVLSLEDVVVDSRSNLLEIVEGVSSSECCSICLGEWDDEECAGMNVVKLPCLHVFHEECLLEWLQGTTHCPMCREEPSTAHTSVFERFAEFGWQPFVEPAETYEFFSVSGIFRRANVDASLDVVQTGAQRLVQRNALFDVCLKSGLAHLVVAYIRAEEPRELQAEGGFAGVKNYVLKEPIAVQQWARRRLEGIEQAVNEMVTEQQFSGRESPRDPKAEAMEEEIRQLNGLRMILIALTERLKEGSREAAYRSHGEGDAVDETELLRLTTDGIQNLLQLLARTQSVSCACNCMLWLEENGVSVDSEIYNAFYSQARTLRVTFREQFEDIYGSNFSSVSGLKDPMLLIEHVMKSAGVSLEDLGGSCPPTQLGQLLELLRTPNIQNDIVQFYGEEIDREPIEGYYRVQVALLLYFCLDRAYLSVWKEHAHSGVRIAKKMRSLADSLAAQLNVRDDMKLTLLALWLVENAVVVKTSGDDQVAALYESAISLLQQSSAMHLHQKYDLEANLILHVLETLVHRGESLVAWKVWNTFGVDLTQSPPAATEFIVVISLELDLWERALSLIRSQKRSDLLGLLFNWLMKSHRLKELVQGATLVPAEETIFHSYMMESNVITDEDVLRDDNIKRVDFLVMYYILRNNRQHQQSSKPALLENEDMDDAFDVAPSVSSSETPSHTEARTNPEAMAPPKGAFIPAQPQQPHLQEVADSEEFAYAPGFFSRPQSIMTRSTDTQASLTTREKTPTPTKSKTGDDVTIGSIDSDSSLNTLTRPKPIFTTGSRGIARQSLDFGTSPVLSSSKPSSTPSTPLHPLVSPLGGKKV
ncbi:hypothetical protein BBO99_00000665 [Phytophthora kernoviae]|uniref:RING-type domain-containing protein n=2 Tax=Phytophthora kernoviae TaxID=325452 RepID=A0A3R7GVL5_9STRA|nr:hypothetical protein G195_004406 [Phytophthora kernoviae 00238/432]KAG2510559.1 hypothetical protein JM16_008499 [Phytophthora kernoviae]KAG2512898.1 hypothetical protein JM18_008521 [Phytophthora kernoviae]RLN44860.1 hypothetical protein BBI17_002804 [Phytophthora kernoviae]RLN85271.1 hypothetical protein BBO99_00000665 [Phytophthora kernoviae]